jgi:hypothetical protein
MRGLDAYDARASLVVLDEREYARAEDVEPVAFAWFTSANQSTPSVAAPAEQASPKTPTISPCCRSGTGLTRNRDPERLGRRRSEQERKPVMRDERRHNAMCIDSTGAIRPRL